MSGSLETSDLLVVVDKGVVYTVNVDAPSIIQISSNDTYYRVADYAYTANTASYSVTSSFALNVPPLPDGIVSSSSQINSGSFSGSFIGDGSQLTGIATDLSFTGDIGSSSINLKTTALDIIGSNGIQTIVSGNTIELIAPIGTVSSSTQIDYQQIQNQPSVIPTASYVEYTGIVNVPTLVSSSTQINYADVQNIPAGIVSSSTQVDYTQLQNLPTISPTSSYVEYANVANKPTLISSSVQINTGSFSGSFIGDGSQLTGLVTDLRISGSTGSDTISLLSDTLQVLGTNGVATTVANNSISISIPAGSVSSSAQINTGSFSGSITSASYASNADLLDGLNSSVFATTGSNTFDGIQIIDNTTNSTLYTNGALVVRGGVGIEKDVNISGSLTVIGLVTAGITGSLSGTAVSASNLIGFSEYSASIQQQLDSINTTLNISKLTLMGF